MATRVLVFIALAILFLPLGVLLRSSEADSLPKDLFAALVCSCGKPAFMVIASKDFATIQPATGPQAEIVCSSKANEAAGVHVLRTEQVTNQSCPIQS